jgi:hypothetical protein
MFIIWRWDRVITPLFHGLVNRNVFCIRPDDGGCAGCARGYAGGYGVIWWIQEIRIKVAGCYLERLQHYKDPVLPLAVGSLPALSYT